MSMDITFLTEEQIWGDKALQVMKDYGTKTGMSDLAIALGGYMGSNTTSDGQRTGYVWSASSGGSGCVRTVGDDGDRGHYGPLRRYGGARPALPSSITSSIKPSEARLTKKICNGKVEVWEYGEYPQTIADEGVNRDLEQAFSRGQLQTTGETYTFDGEKYDAYDQPFNAKKYAEYQLKGKRYIRVEAQPRDNDSVLSNGSKPQTGEACWIEVQPIEWLKDPSGVMVARQALFSGVQFDRKKSYDGNFANTDMKQYLQNHFAKEMMAGLNVSVPAAIGPNTASVTSRRAAQRQRALDDPSQGL